MRDGGEQRSPALLAFLLAGFIWSSGWLKTWIPVRYFLAFVLSLCISYLLRYRKSRLRTWSALAGLMKTLLVPAVISISAFFVVFHPFNSSVGDSIFRYYILFPLAVSVGFLSAEAPKWKQSFERAMIIWACISTLLALGEILAGSPLIERTASLDRWGFIRGTALAEHPITLAATLLWVLSFLQNQVVSISRRRLLTGILVLGIVLKFSRGVLTIALFWLLALSGRRSVVFVRSVAYLARTTIVVGLAVLMYVVFGHFRTSFDILTAVGDQASAQYRVNLYQALVVSLQSHPFGWGVAGLPKGDLLMLSVDGVKDLSTTIDSEVVLASVEFGFLGLASIVFLYWKFSAPKILVETEGLSGFALLLCGLFVAIHAWTAFPIVLILALANVRGDKRKSDGSNSEANANRIHA